jgi:hypothetical protein
MSCQLGSLEEVKLGLDSRDISAFFDKAEYQIEICS